MKFLFLDTETTGTDTSKHCIHQISGAIIIDGTVKEVFDIKFKPREDAEISDEALKATNLTLDDLYNRKLSYKEGYECFINILNKYVNRYDRADKMFLVGYNVHFDKDFIYRLFVDNDNNYLFAYIWGNHVDVMVLATTLLANQRHLMKDFKQGTVAKYLGFNIDEEKLHDALFDIYICIGLYCYITKEKFQALETFFNTGENIFNNLLVEQYANPQEHLYKKNLETIVTFGKHKGKTVGQLLIENPGYIVWVYEECKNQQIVTEQIYKEAKEKFQTYLDSKNKTKCRCTNDKVIDHQLDNYLCNSFDDDVW